MQWFRLYSEFATDPKVQMLSEAMQRRLIMLFCMKCNNETLQDSEVAFQLRISADEWVTTKEIFIEKKFINYKNDILNWNKRQYKSDTSKERVKRYRDKKRNVTVTPPETEQIQIQNRVVKRENKREAISLDELSEKHIETWLAEKRAKGVYLNHDPTFVLEQLKDYCKSSGKKYNDYTAAYRNAFTWEKCKPQENYGKTSKYTATNTKPSKFDVLTAGAESVIADIRAGKI